MNYHLASIWRAFIYFLNILFMIYFLRFLHHVIKNDRKCNRRKKLKNDTAIEDDQISGSYTIDTQITTNRLSNDNWHHALVQKTSRKRRIKSSPELNKSTRILPKALKNSGVKYNEGINSAQPRLMTSLSADRAVDSGFVSYETEFESLIGAIVPEPRDSCDSFDGKCNASSKLFKHQTSLQFDLENLYETKYSDTVKEQILERLEKGDFDPNHKNSFGRTILHTAVQCCWPVSEDKLEIIKKILELETLDIDAKDNAGRTALHFCVYKSAKLDILKLLVKYNASVNCRDDSGYAPIHYVSMKEKKTYHEILKFMLHSDKFDVNFKDSQGKTPLHTAISPKLSENVINLLLESPQLDVNIADNSNKTPLHYICRKKNQHQNIAKFLERGELELINRQDDSGKTPIHYAAACVDNGGSLEFLMKQQDIRLNVEDQSKRTPLHYCAMKNPKKLGLLLDQKEIDVRCKDQMSWTVLHHAANNGAPVEVIEKIVQLGTCDIISWTDCNSGTALEIAEQNGYQEIADFLRKQQSSFHTRTVSLENVKFDDLLHEIDGHDLVMKILKERKEQIKGTTEKSQTFLHILVGSFSSNRKLSLEKVLESKLIDINSKDCDGLTPLHYAVNILSTDYVKVLLEQTEIDVNMTDKHGQTPLHYVAKSGNFDIASLLISHANIDVNILDKKKKSALHYACKSQLDGRIKIIELLLNDQQIELKRPDKKCRSVFHYCCISGQPACIIEKLIDMINDHEVLTGLDLHGKTPYYYAKQYEHTHILVVLENSPFVITEKQFKTVSQLQPSDLQQLSDLKKNLGSYLWEKFCWKLNEKNLVCFTEIDISAIKDPAEYEVGKIIIENIKTKNPTFTTTDLYNTAKSIDRNDICNLLSIEETVISDIPHVLQCQLSMLCGKRVAGIQGPLIIAEKCDILNDWLATEINEKKVVKCPVVTLFGIIKIKNPTLSLNTIVEVFNELNFISLANTLKKIISSDDTRRPPILK